LEKIKACGFTVESSEAEINGTYMYTASNSKGDKVSFSSSSDMGSITFEKSE